MATSVLVTKNGFIKLSAEVDNLKNVERPKIIADIAEARSHGDLRENSEYAAAKDNQRMLESRIAEIEMILSNATIFDPTTVANEGKITFGATVSLLDIEANITKTLQIVSEYEADIANGLISIKAPIAIALIGKSKGDEVTIMMSGKKTEFSVESIKY